MGDFGFDGWEFKSGQLLDQDGVEQD